VPPRMYPDRFRLPFLAGVLIAAAERRRPALGPWSPAVEAALTRSFDPELDEVRRSFLETFEDPAWFARVEQKIRDVALPRYLAEARRQTELEQRGWGLWRGGDLVSRIVWGLGGFALGIFLVKAPFIPIPTTWDLLAFAFLLGAPFVPDLQMALLRGRHRRALRAIVEDLGGGLSSGTVRGVIVGGPLAGVLPPRHFDAPLAFEELHALGASVGHGGVVAFDDHTSIRDLVQHVFAFGAYESCGRCTPCRLGARAIEDMVAGHAGVAWDAQRFEDIVSALEATSLCGHGTGLAEFAHSVLRHYGEELAACFT